MFTRSILFTAAVLRLTEGYLILEGYQTYHTLTVSIGERVSLQCDARKEEVTWFFSTHTATYPIFERSRAVTNINGVTLSRDGRLDVLVKEEFLNGYFVCSDRGRYLNTYSLKPKTTQSKTTAVYGRLNQYLSLPCSLGTGGVSWFRDNVRIFDNGIPTTREQWPGITLNQGRLDVKLNRDNDKKIFYCASGTRRGTIYSLHIYGGTTPPNNNNILRHETVQGYPGETKYLTCHRSTGAIWYRDDIAIFKNGQPINVHMPGVTLTRDGRLAVVINRENFQTQFYCNAAGMFGTVYTIKAFGNTDLLP